MASRRLFGFLTVSRRNMVGGAAAVAAVAGLTAAPLTATAENRSAASAKKLGTKPLNTMTMKDGTEIYYKNWGSGRPVIFSHGWPLNADAWDDQMFFLASRGFRCIAFDRRGFGRSGQSWDGNDYDTFADDLATLIETLDLNGAVMVGHSAGAGDIVRYIGRYGAQRVSKTVLVSSIPPLMLKTPANPGGLPIEVFDGIRAALLSDRAQFYRNLGDGPFYGANRPGSKVSQGVKDALWLWSMQAGLRPSYEGIRAFSETDFTADLAKIDVPTLIIHGDDDQNVPIADSALLSSKLIKKATLKIYPGAPHGLMVTHKDQFNGDLLAFMQTERPS
jgi:non-heme chloroperoxidase